MTEDIVKVMVDMETRNAVVKVYPVGSVSPVHRSLTAPLNTELIWFDPSDGSSSVWVETAWVVFSGAPSSSAESIGLDQVDNTSDEDKPVSTATQEALDDKADAGTLMPVINVLHAPYNAAGDGMRADVLSITSGAAILTCPSALWTADHVGKYIRVEGAGVAGADLITTILSRQSSTQVTLAANASTTVTLAGSAFFGTDDSAAIQAALNAAATSTDTRIVYAPPRQYLCNVIIPQGVHFKGAFYGNVIHVLETPAQLANRQLTGTVLLPAVSTAPVIWGQESTGTVFGSTVEGFTVSGSAAKAGNGIQFGNEWGDNGFSSANARILHCRVAGFDVAVIHGNAVDGEIGHVWANQSNIGFQIYRHDGLFIHQCSTTDTDLPFRISGCKNLHISTGNFNQPGICFDITNSNVSVGTLNVEFPTAEIFALRSDGSGTVSLSADYIIGLSAGPVTFVRDYVVAAAFQTLVSVDIRGATGGTDQFYDSANTSYPTSIKGIAFIRRYTDATFTTLNRIEKVRRVYLSPWEQEAYTRVVKDEFLQRRSGSPYGDLGWIYSTLAGNYSAVTEHESALAPGTIIVSSVGATGTDAVRFWAASTVMNPLNGYWKMQWILRVTHTTTATFRAGVYSTDTTSLKPNNGIGFRIDSSLGDTTIKLEVLDAGTPITVDTGIASSSLQTVRRIVMQRTNKGVTLALFQADGLAQIAPEVIYESALPAWTSQFHRPSILTGVNSAVAQSIFVNQFLHTQYVNSEF